MPLKNKNKTTTTTKKRTTTQKKTATIDSLHRPTSQFCHRRVLCLSNLKKPSQQQQNQQQLQNNNNSNNWFLVFSCCFRCFRYLAAAPPNVPNLFPTCLVNCKFVITLLLILILWFIDSHGVNYTLFYYLFRIVFSASETIKTTIQELIFFQGFLFHFWLRFPSIL